MMRWDAILRRVPTDRPFTLVEVGVWKADTAARLLAARPRLTMYLVDPYEPFRRKSGEVLTASDMGLIAAEASRRVRPWSDRVHWRRCTSLEAASQFRPGSVDAVFIDARHAYPYVRDDIDAWRPAAKAGGWIGGHDYASPIFPGVKRAVDETFGSGGGVECDDDLTWFACVPSSNPAKAGAI